VSVDPGVYARITDGYHHGAVDTYPRIPYGATAPEATPVTGDVVHPEQRHAGVRRAAGPIAVAAAALGKYGLILLKLGKFGPTLVSMALTIGLMARIFGWAYGVGLVVLIAVHESGHLLFARYEGIKVSAPIFLGPFGAVIGLKQPPKDARQEAVIAIGGPVVGTLGAIVALVWSMAAADGTYAHGLLLALAYVGFLINLFNLIPFTPLDGGRVAGALSPWANVVGLGIVLLLIAGPVLSGGALNPLLLAILVIGGISTWQRFKSRGTRPHYESIPGSTRAWIGAAYAVMLAVTAVGMSATHAALQAVAAGGTL
jgi:Zn-dependent protease